LPTPVLWRSTRCPISVNIRVPRRSLGDVIGLIARKIRDVAREHDIPVVENPPLARALHGTVEIDQEIPPEHYRAVAEVIGYIMRLKRGFSAGRG